MVRTFSVGCIVEHVGRKCSLFLFPGLFSKRTVLTPHCKTLDVIRSNSGKEVITKSCTYFIMRFNIAKAKLRPFNVMFIEFFGYLIRSKNRN